MTLEERHAFIIRYETVTRKQDETNGFEYARIEKWLDENEELYLECLNVVDDMRFKEKNREQDGTN